MPAAPTIPKKEGGEDAEGRGGEVAGEVRRSKEAARAGGKTGTALDAEKVPNAELTKAAENTLSQEKQGARRSPGRSRPTMSKKGEIQLKIEDYEHVQDQYFLKKMVVPYLSSVYLGLVAGGTKDYASLLRTKQYLNLPEALAERICCQINANGDERIDHDEFIDFMITLLMGNRHQKMMIAFRCFDPEDNEFIMAEDVKYLLKHVPLTVEERHGISFGFYD